MIHPLGTTGAMTFELAHAIDGHIDALRERGWQRDDVIRAVERAFRGRGLPASEAAVDALLSVLPPLPRVDDGGGTLPNGLLAKVRALLAKAESTEFEAEADALTAKAQELITKYRIDAALLRAGSVGRDSGVVTRRIHIDEPYADAKTLLLSRIARANGACVLWSRRLGLATVFGTSSDNEATELLFTSLLMQASVGLRREGSRVDECGRNRTRRFRRSFLVGFALRIGERLEAATADTVAAADPSRGTSLVPLLTGHAAAAEAAARAASPKAGTFDPSVSDAEGWAKGRQFGDRAQLRTAGLNP